MLKFLKYNRTFVSKLKSNCDFVHAHDFNNALNNVDLNGMKLIDYIHALKDNCYYYNNTSSAKNLHLTDKEQKKLVIDFFYSIDSSLGARISDILENLDPNYDTTILTEKSKSYVEGNNSGIAKFVTALDGTIEGLWVLAHESSHALSSRQTEGDRLVREYNEHPTEENKQKKNKYFNRLSKWDIDCIAEIESYITEELFMQYLLSKNIISDNDIVSRRESHFNSLLNEAILISEENDILSNLSDPISFDSFRIFLTKIKGKPYENILLNRCDYMANRGKKDNKYSQYMFRYFIGRITSYQWIDQYLKLNNLEKREMLNDFTKYLSTTHKININEATTILLHEDLSNILEDYYNLITNNNQIST